MNESNSCNEGQPVEILGLFISPAHNFKGHYGKPAGKNPIESKDSVECVAGKGIVGDRYFGLEENYKGQITFLDDAVYQALCEGVDAKDCDPQRLRRNVLIKGVDLNSLIDQTFEIAGIQFKGMEECSPCFWMNGAVAEGAEEFLKNQGGLRAQILSDGTLPLGATVLQRVERSWLFRLRRIFLPWRDRSTVNS